MQVDPLGRCRVRVKAAVGMSRDDAPIAATLDEQLAAMDSCGDVPSTTSGDSRSRAGSWVGVRCALGRARRRAHVGPGSSTDWPLRNGANMQSDSCCGLQPRVHRGRDAPSRAAGRRDASARVASSLEPFRAKPVRSRTPPPASARAQAPAEVARGRRACPPVQGHLDWYRSRCHAAQRQRRLADGTSSRGGLTPDLPSGAARRSR